MDDTFSKPGGSPYASRPIIRDVGDDAARLPPVLRAAGRAVGLLVFAWGGLGAAAPARAELQTSALLRVASNYLCTTAIPRATTIRLASCTAESAIPAGCTVVPG